MFNAHNLVDQLHDDSEAFILISACGFTAQDWPALKKLGEARSVVQSDLFGAMLRNLALKQSVELFLPKMRALLDGFYSQGGFLMTQASHRNLRLFNIPQAPLVFFARYHQEAIHKKPMVAIVGSRSASEYGMQFTQCLSGSLAEQGFTIVSGGASGIDKAAHQGAMKAKGETILVTGLSCSLRQDQFVQHSATAMQEKILILYPFGPLSPQGKYMFIERNRYVAALADALIVVQGLEGSGTLHTVKFAQKLKIPIFAVPGGCDNPLSFVPNALLASGQAKALINPKADFTSILGGSNQPRRKKAPVIERKSEVQLPELLQIIQEHGPALTMPQIMALAKKSFLETQRELMGYELAGRIVKRGPQFVLTGN